MLQRCVLLRPAVPSALLSWTSSIFSRSATKAAAVAQESSPSDTASVATTADSATEGSRKSILVADVSAKGLGEKHLGNFYKLQPSLLQEALLPALPGKQARESSPCAGLQDEVAATRNQAIMYREAMHALKDRLSKPQSRLLLQGPAGTGKSVAVASMVEWARANGWIVMYIPSAALLTKGGYFLLRESTGQYDTILSAQQILRSMVQAHGKQLAAMPSGASASQDGKTSVSARTLLDVAKEGLASDTNAVLAVDACLALKEGLVAASKNSSSPRVLFAIDDYNSLYWRTGYGRTAEDGQRVALKVDDLTLASGLRLLAGGDTGNAAVLAATSASRGVRNDVSVPAAPHVTPFHMPRYSLVETAHALYWYWECGLIPHSPREDQVRAMYALTNGNAKEVRMLAPKIPLFKSGLL